MSLPDVGVIDLTLNIPGEDVSAWYDFMKPLLLDEGKWCLRAEAIDPPGEHTHEPKFASRVYAVTVKDDATSKPRAIEL